MVEVELAKEYALRVKDKATAEQVNAAAAAHAAELKAQRQMLLDLRQESEGLLSDRDRQLQQSQEKHQASPIISCKIPLQFAQESMDNLKAPGRGAKPQMPSLKATSTAGSSTAQQLNHLST